MTRVLIFICFICALHVYSGGAEQSGRQGSSNFSRAPSAGKVRSINYASAQEFLDRCIEVKDIHFSFERKNQQDLPPPIIPPSTPPPSIHSNKGRQTRKCLDYKCFANFLRRDLRQIDGFRCRNDNDCRSSEEKLQRGNVESNMVCRTFTTSNSKVRFCDCPKYMAYNPLSCQCEPAEQCGNSSKVYCQNGMKCMDAKCSCSNFEKVLIEPHGQFCVEKKTTDTVNQFPFAQVQTSDGGFLTAIIILACVASVFVIGLCVYLSSQSLKNGFFDRGQYICDETSKEKTAKTRRSGEGQPRTQEKTSHVAAWDLPGLDVLTEEQTMKYIQREHQRQLQEDSVQDPDGRFLDDENLSAITSTPNSTSYLNHKMNTNNIALKRFGGQHNVNRPVHNLSVNGATAGDGSTTCASSSSSPSSGRSGGGSLPESERFDNPGGENIKNSNGQEVQNDPNGDLQPGNLNNSSKGVSMSKLSVHSLTMQSNIL